MTPSRPSVPVRPSSRPPVRSTRPAWRRALVAAALPLLAAGVLTACAPPSRADRSAASPSPTPTPLVVAGTNHNAAAQAYAYPAAKVQGWLRQGNTAPDYPTQKIAFLPFGLMVDRWRWSVYSGETTPAGYNDAWTALMLKYQGLTPPGPRPANAFDPGAKYHVPGNVPYTRYFLAHIYQFQFHRAACQQAGWSGPLHRCSVFGQREVGQRFNAMMQMGQSRPWPDALEAFTGQRQTDASAVTDYFAALNTWLTVQNRGEKCGW